MDGLHRIRTGDVVVIVAADDFYAFVDGWYGCVAGWNNGLAKVRCTRPDGEKILFVPPEQLHLALGATV